MGGFKNIAGVVGIAALVTLIGLMGYGMYAGIKENKTSEVTTSIAAPKAVAPREVKDVLTNNVGDLIITYTDGSTQNAGHVVGPSGSNGSSTAPTQAQISAALLEYCADGKCDAKSPTQAQIIDAINSYCSNGQCKGRDGANASPITSDQIINAVASFCSDGRCRGADGQTVTGPIGATGAKGDTGISTRLSCVTRPLNQSTANYIAWKYENEPDESYRNLYKLPVWAEASNCITIS